MRIDRLLSLIIFLLNHDLVSARELAERFDVSVRTIQRDMETIDRAGIPVMSVKGPSGGYGIMETYKMDRQFVTLDDLFYIITALSGIGASISNQKIGSTIEKMKNLLPGQEETVFGKQQERLYIDFSMLGGTEKQQEVFRIIEKAIDGTRLLRITYTSNKLETTRRVLEPMTIAFKWRSWYLFAYCRLKKDYRLFRLSRIGDAEILEDRFRRREKSFEDFMTGYDMHGSGRAVDLVLAFSRELKPLVEEYYQGEDTREDEQGRLITHVRMPEDGWVYGIILSYGTYVEVLSPEHVRNTVRVIAGKIGSIYE